MVFKIYLGAGLFAAGALSASAQGTATVPDAARAAERATEIRELRGELGRIAARLDALEKEDAAAVPASPATAPETAEVQPPALPEKAPEAPRIASFLPGTTVNVAFDGYYDYNFNAPIGRVNLLRAYEVSSNSFSINQADLMLERLPTPESRVGGRLDLMWGQATETLGGSPANEQRPQVWRNLFQAYGSYLAPVGSGLQLDFGKFASSLGFEGDYAKDQISYSRSFAYNFLPFYHLGLRTNYNITPKVNLAYWLVNGAQQSEDFNGSKSQAFLWTLKPASSVTWNVNYYFGEEARDVQPTLNPGLPTEPTQPGLPTANVSPAPNGREHIFDSYATWNATKNWTFAGEADYVLNRANAEQKPPRVILGALYAKYTLPHDWYVAGRTEYFDDRGGLFSGQTQALKEITVTANHQFAPGFAARMEYRRDFSNQRFFLSDTAGSLKHAQTTGTVGLLYWWGTKTGSW